MTTYLERSPDIKSGGFGVTKIIKLMNDATALMKNPRKITLFLETTNYY